MKIAVVGSREFPYKALVTLVLEYTAHSHDVIISGGARGVDTWAKEYALAHNIKYEEYPAEWDKHGKSAGYIRNKLIIENANVVLAFWDGKSKGTKHSIDLALKLNKELSYFDIDTNGRAHVHNHPAK